MLKLRLVATALVLASCVRRTPDPDTLPPPQTVPLAVAHDAGVTAVPDTKPAVEQQLTVADAGVAVEPIATRPTFDIKARIANMTVAQKVGQLMMVGFGGTFVDEDIRALVRGREVGGVCMFKRNIVSAGQIARLNDQVRELLSDSLPPFISVDQEGGNVVRVSDEMVVLPGNMALGATRSEKLAYEAGRVQGEHLKSLGFNMNLAPVLDVNVNPKNPVIGIRSFGDDPALVSALGRAFVRGQQDAQIVTIAKHFPGHGNTDADSHKALPRMTETLKELMWQIGPFEDVIKDGLDGLMTAHVAMPNVTGDEHPATLSRKILTDLLRKRMGFDGLVMTDELEMEAIATHYGVGKAAVMAISSGADMVLIPWRPEKKTEVYESLLEASNNGELPRERLDDAVRHVLEAKVRRGLFDPIPRLEERLAQLRSDKGHQIAADIGRQAVTLLRTDDVSLPLKRKQRILVVTAEQSLAEAVKRRAPTAVVLVVPAYPSDKKRGAARLAVSELAKDADIVVVGMINSKQLELVTMASIAGKPVVVVSMGLPYLAEQANEARAVMALYSYRPSMTEAAAAALFGETDTPGRLPVTLKSMPFGHGISKKTAGAVLGQQTDARGSR